MSARRGRRLRRRFRWPSSTSERAAPKWCPRYPGGMAAGSALPPVVAVSVEEYLATSYKPACSPCTSALRFSPDDRMSKVLAKCEEYHAWGVPTVWIADPENERAWEYRAGQRPKEIAVDGSLTANGI